jgi:hypothetical protein
MDLYVEMGIDAPLPMPFVLKRNASQRLIELTKPSEAYSEA